MAGRPQTRVRRDAIAVVLVVIAWLAIGSDPRATQGGAAPASPPPLAEETNGNKLIDGGKREEGLRLLERAAIVYRRSGDRRAVARVFLRMTAVFRQLAKPDQAARYAQQAFDAAEAGSAQQISALTLLGRIATDRADLTRADAWLRQALSLSERAGDAQAESAILRALGRVTDLRGQQREALELQQRAIAAADRSGDLASRAVSRGQTSATLLGLSRFDDGLALAQEAFEISRAAPAAIRADALFTLAQANSHVWNLERAATLWTAAIEAHREAGNLPNLALATKQSVETWFARGEFDRAVADGEKAVELLRQVGMMQYVPETMARLALSEARRGRLEAASDWSTRARAELPLAPASRHLFVHNDLGLVAVELGDLTQAHADFTRVLEVAREIGNIEYDWRGQWGLGRAMTAGKDWPGAMQSLERAIAMVERLRQTIPEAGMRATFMTNRVGPYETLVEATMASSARGNDEAARAALHVAERARSRALADLLAEARARLTDPRLQAVRSEEIAFGQRFSAAGRRASAATDPVVRKAALEDLKTLEHDYEALVLKIRRENLAYAALAHPRALTAREISAMLAPDEALLEFLITEKRGFAWIVRRDRVEGYQVPGQAALAPQILFQQALLAANDEPALQRLGTQLYDRLIGPAGPALEGVRRLIIVPDGALQRVPFALLRTGDRWLVDRFVLSLAPSATILEYLRQPPAGRAARPLLALAAPDAPAGATALFDMGQQALATLTHASQEVADITARVGAETSDRRTGAAATEQVLKSAEAGTYRIIHFAAHAVVDEIVPRRSAVLLAPSGSDDGLLQVSEIANLSLSADLVVLAACRSHVGRLVRGEGLLSLSRAFFHAGARAIVATSWAVEDRETAWLMREFYRALADGFAADEALQYAQRRALAAGGRRASPAGWGAFLVIGDARTPIFNPRDTTSRGQLILVAGVAAGLALVALGVRRKTRRADSTNAKPRRG